MKSRRAMLDFISDCQWLSDNGTGWTNTWTEACNRLSYHLDSHLITVYPIGPCLEPSRSTIKHQGGGL